MEPKICSLKVCVIEIQKEPLKLINFVGIEKGNSKNN